MLLPSSIYSLPITINGSPETPIPQFIAQSFIVKLGSIGTNPCVFADFGSQTPTLPLIRKTNDELIRRMSLPVVFHGNRLSHYQKEVMTSKNISFVLSQRNAFLPFIGLVLLDDLGREDVSAFLSPQAQRLFLNILNGEWMGLSVSETAERMGKSNSSASNYFYEIEGIAPVLFQKKGKHKVITRMLFNRREIFDLLLPHLHSPVKQRFYTTSDASALVKRGALFSGITALSRLSSIADSTFPTVAVTSAMLDHFLEDSKGEYTTVSETYRTKTIVETWHYWPDYHEPKRVDSISLYLSLAHEAQTDERMNKALSSLLERSLNERAGCLSGVL